MIREAPTSSSSESNFTDPESPAHADKLLHNLTVTKLEQLDLHGEQQKLRVVHNESISFEGTRNEAEEMPIVKKKDENGPPENGAADKGIFSVSRVKKVELSEIPMNCTTCKFPLEPPRTQRISHILV